MYENIKECVNDFICREIENIKKEKMSCKNISYAFRGVGNLGEELATCIYPNSYCSASKGGCSFDNIEINADGDIITAREIKTCCKVQPKKCNNCLRKVPYFYECCVFCKHNEFTIIKDTRFGIDTRAHFEYIGLLKEYVLILIDFIDDKIKLSVFIIKSDNPYFHGYLKSQLEKSTKSNTCNLIPFSYDFYASGPIRIIELEYDLLGNLLNEYIDIFNDKHLDFDTSCLQIKEKQKYEISSEITSITYEEIKDKLSMRDKKYDKDRGKTTRL